MTVDLSPQPLHERALLQQPHPRFSTPSLKQRSLERALLQHAASVAGLKGHSHYCAQTPFAGKVLISLPCGTPVPAPRRCNEGSKAF